MNCYIEKTKCLKLISANIPKPEFNKNISKRTNTLPLEITNGLEHTNVARRQSNISIEAKNIADKIPHFP